MTPAHALFAAIRSRLLSDAPLIARLGGTRIHDGPPRNASFPYVSLDEVAARDLSGLAAPLTELTLTIRAFARSGGHSEALALGGAIAAALDDADLALTGCRLVRLAARTSDTRLGRDRQTAETTVRLTALVEPVA